MNPDSQNLKKTIRMTNKIINQLKKQEKIIMGDTTNDP